jgi:hypothetical protein
VGAHHNAAVSLGARGAPFTVLGNRVASPEPRASGSTRLPSTRCGSRSMADDTAPAAPIPIELLLDDTLGHCDPVTGVCALPGPRATPQSLSSLHRKPKPAMRRSTGGRTPGSKSGEQPCHPPSDLLPRSRSRHQ